MKEFKGCPFCGDTNAELKGHEPWMVHQIWKQDVGYIPIMAGGYYVECQSCGGRTGLYDTKEQAVEKWE